MECLLPQLMFNLENMVLLIGADKIVDYTDRSTCIIFGDGAVQYCLSLTMKD
jgi:3-oxoacyl-[acyl-carrier-protein] synthase III